MTDAARGRKQARKSVGVRMPADPVCRAVLEGFGGCLLSHSVHVADQLGGVGEQGGVGTRECRWRLRTCCRPPGRLAHPAAGDRAALR